MIGFFVPCVGPGTVLVKVSVIEVVSNIGVNLSSIFVIEVSVSAKVVDIPIAISLGKHLTNNCVSYFPLFCSSAW